MRFLTSILFAVIAVAAPDCTHAFTQGFTLLPSYLCGPAVPNITSGVLIGADKLPKALGGVLNLFQLQTPAHFEGNVYDANVDPRYWVGAYHNVVAQTKAIQFYGQGPNKLTDPAALAALKNMPDVIPIIPQVYVIGVNKIPANPAATPINQDPIAATAFLPNVITPNELVTLSVFVQNNDIFPVTGLPGPTQKAANKYVQGSDVALDGAIIYAQTPANQRVGKFVVPVVAADAKVPSTFSVWPACGADGAGIVHNQVLSDTNIVNGGAQFFLPWNFLLKNPQVKQITFMGAAVTDNGFGYHQTTWTVQAAAPFTLTGTIANAANALPKCTSKANFPVQQPCFAACLQCLQLANGAANVVPMCTPDLAIGDPAKGQQTVFTSGCMVNGVPQKVVPAATPLVMGNLQLKTAAADTTEVAGAAQLMDQIKAAMDNNGTDTTSSSTPACQSGNVNSASTISTVSATTLLTALTVTFGTLFATRQ